MWVNLRGHRHQPTALNNSQGSPYCWMWWPKEWGQRVTSPCQRRYQHLPASRSPWNSSEASGTYAFTGFIFGPDQDELAHPAHHMVLETTSWNQGSELSNSAMIPTNDCGSGSDMY